MDRCIIIAEAGVNHNGSVALAKKMIDVAVEAGVDFVKFQTFKAEKLVSREAPKALYQDVNMPGKKGSQYEMLKRLELSEADHFELANYAKEHGIKFFCTAFDEDGLDFLEKLDIEIFKVPSGEITNLPYLKRIAQKGKPTILSTGMSTLGEIEAAISVLIENGLDREKLTVLHCNTEYPTPFIDVNLKAMDTIRHALKVNVGYSDHTMGIEVPIASVSLGASIIEKHFTLDRSMEGPDHIASLEPQELKAMVTAIRNLELALGGDGIKKPSPSELKNREIARKSIHLRRNLTRGHIITIDDIIMKRPGNGISPMDMDFVIGRKLSLDLAADSLLKYGHLID
ncbi:MAG: N-acetylneuraminate synthase [Cyclobacteriaceae bacterium]|nr:N-acetylneuraminate synthase [Cyclobacteriaceae bacterium]MCB0504911.1 N-acetylneuraminate synthase [Cyclobacteriaceae bacterium]MCB9238042.1 N-acetylneuraminate synthase [Flammeovirgaceae bacterium]MCO5272566.1 N-acetylneuraminate synthase [Cyclobacteriaceae bacterium]MCW5901634.1 N-acetylneuraminate synthase [Cyclobacteriaceae bacterium]